MGKTFESPLDCKEIQPIHPKGNQSWIFIGRADAEAETPIFWPPDTKNWFTGKDPDAGKDWRQKEKGTTEDEMVGWHHWPNGHEFEQTLGDGERQGGLTCCSPWGHKELDTTKCLNNNHTKGFCLQSRRHRLPLWVVKIIFLEEGTSTHFSIPAWRTPWAQEPGGLQSMGLQRVGHNWSNWAHNPTKISEKITWDKGNSHDKSSGTRINLL